MTGRDADQVVLGNGADSILINLSLVAARAGRRGRVRLAELHHVPDQRAQGRRRAGAGAARRRAPLRPRRDARRGHRPHAHGLRVQPQQPDRHVRRSRATDALRRRAARARAVRDRRGVPRVRHRATTTPTRSASSSSAGRDNVLVLRTMSKIYGLAGLRVGWGVGPAQVVRAVDTVRGPFEMNALRQRRGARQPRRARPARRARRAPTRPAAHGSRRRCASVGLDPMPGVGELPVRAAARRARPAGGRRRGSRTSA